MTGKATIGGSPGMKTPRMHGATYMLAPTDRSMPAISSTKVMPIAMIAMCADWVRMLMKLTGVRKRPDSRPKTTTSSRNSRIGAFCSGSRREPVAIAHHGAAPCRHALALASPSHIAAPQDRLAVEAGPLEAAADLAVAHDQDAVAHADQLLDLRGDHQDAGAARRPAVDDLVDLVLAPTSMPRVGSSRMKTRGAAQQPFADDDLLLVAARQVLDQRALDVAGLPIWTPAEVRATSSPRRASLDHAAEAMRRRRGKRRQGDVVRRSAPPSSGLRRGGPRSGRPCRAPCTGCGLGCVERRAADRDLAALDRGRGRTGCGPAPSGRRPSGRRCRAPRRAAATKAMSLTMPGWLTPVTSSTGGTAGRRGCARREELVDASARPSA